MPKIRDIMVHVSVETAKGQRRCHRRKNEHVIPTGCNCLVVRDPVSGGSKNYCPECASPILEHAEAKLAELRRGLSL